MKLIITGGHLSPLLSIIDVLPKDIEVLVIGRKHALEGDSAFSLEYQTLKNKKIPFRSITAARLQRKFTSRTFFSLLKFPFGLWQSFLILKKFKPNVVLTFGGYISLPVVFSAFVLCIPVVIHEQTLEAGLANRISSFFAKKVCISWESSKKFFPRKKTILTGNPIRKFLIFQFSNREHLPIIYITGGSLGSHSINVLVEDCLKKLLEKYIIFHQVGDAKEYLDYDRLFKLKNSFEKKLQERYLLTKFVIPDEVGTILQKADLVISRSGINTVSELIFFKKLCLLIPLPYSQNNEQIKNALFLKGLGFGEVVSQKELTPEKLFGLIQSMIENKDLYQKKIEEAKFSIRKDAASKIIEILKEVEFS